MNWRNSRVKTCQEHSRLSSIVQDLPRVFDHVLSTVMDALHCLLSAHNLTRPGKWGDLSAKHLEVVKNFLEVVHKGLEAATLNAELLSLKPPVWIDF
jgi:hypothetical protein